MARKPLISQERTAQTQRLAASTGPMRRALKTAEIVALEIVRNIGEQRLEPGDRLPLESEMLTQYRVSRSSLREALRLLETQGLIAIRPGPGSGTIVSHPAPSNLGRTMTLYFHMAGATYDELLDAWLLTEPVLAELAAKNPERARRAALMSPFLLTGQDCEIGPHDIAEGRSFHDAVAELADNRVLDIMFRAIGFIVSDHILLSKDRSELEAFIVDDHAKLAKAIIDGKPALARQLMAEHVRNVVADFKAYWPRKVGERVRWS